MPTELKNVAVSNGLPPPKIELPYPDRPEIITENLLKLTEEALTPRNKLIFTNLVTHLHQFVTETEITTEEWMTTIHYLTSVGKTCTPLRQEFILLSDVLGVSALVDAINNPPSELKGKLKATESSVLGPFFTDDAPDLQIGDSIASEGDGEHMYVQGRILSIEGKPIPGAVIETWEGDANGFYDTQYADRTQPDYRGRLRSDKEGKYGYRAIVPVPYPIPGDGPVGDLLVNVLNRHNMRPNHLHALIAAPGFRTLTTALYPEGDKWLTSDPVFGVKHSLVVKLQTVTDDAKARALGFPEGGAFKLLEFDFVLVPESE